jgi:hypothetical protein
VRVLRTKWVSIYSKDGNEQGILRNVNVAKPGVLVIVQTDMGWNLGITIQHDGLMNIVHCGSSQNSTGLVFNLGHTVIKSQAMPTIIEDKDFWFSLNNESHNKAMSSRQGIIPKRNAMKTDITPKIVVWSFDNRKHHKYNDADILHTAERIHWMGELVGKPQLAEMKITHNKPFNRLCYHKGQIKYAHEFSEDIFKVFKDIIKLTGVDGSSHLATTLYTPHKLIRLVTELIDMCKTHNNKILPHSEISSGDYKIYNLEHFLEPSVIDILKAELGDAVTVEPYESGLSIINLTSHDNGVIIVNNPMYKQLVVVQLGLTFTKTTIGGANELINTMTEIKHGTDEQPTWIGGTKQAVKGGVHKEDKWHQIVQDNRVEKGVALDILAWTITLIDDDNTYVDGTDGINVDDEEHNLAILYQGRVDTITSSDLDTLAEDIPHIVIDLWETDDLTHWLTIHTPKEGTIKTREQAQRIIRISKPTMTKYPVITRAVHNKLAFAELRSVVKILHSVEHIRTEKPSKEYVMNNMRQAYWRPDWPAFERKFQDNLVNFNPDGTETWFKEHEDAPEKIKQMLNMIAGNSVIEPINDVKMHLKLESLYKETPINNWQNQEVRAIVWQKYAIASLFSPIFVELKRRLKLILREGIMYTDGMTAEQISDYTRLTRRVKWFLEDDLTKQDRQTDDVLLEVEFEVYRILGMHPSALEIWKQMHRNWRYKTGHSRGLGNSMRMTGQASTSLGNALTNLQVHSEFVRENRANIECMLILGDDNLMMLNMKPNVVNLRKQIRVRYNMESKAELSDTNGAFCANIAYIDNDGNPGLGPDIIRMKYKYEVPNGISDCNAENAKLKAMSYCMQLGDLPQVRELIKKENFPIKPTPWYDYPNCLAATAQRYNLSYDEVELELGNLMHMLETRQFYDHNMEYYTSSSKRNI